MFQCSSRGSSGCASTPNNCLRATSEEVNPLQVVRYLSIGKQPCREMADHSTKCSAAPDIGARCEEIRLFGLRHTAVTVAPGFILISA